MTPSLNPADYSPTLDEIEAVCCPECWADAGRACETKAGNVCDVPHRRRVRKARTISRDIAVAGCLPEHDGERYEAAMARLKEARR